MFTNSFSVCFPPSYFCELFHILAIEPLIRRQRFPGVSLPSVTLSLAA